MPDDFLGFLPPDKAAAAFHYIDDNDSGRVAQSELLNAVVQIFRCSALQDTTFLSRAVRQDWHEVIWRISSGDSCLALPYLAYRDIVYQCQNCLAKRQGPAQPCGGAEGHALRDWSRLSLLIGVPFHQGRNWPSTLQGPAQPCGGAEGHALGDRHAADDRGRRHPHLLLLHVHAGAAGRLSFVILFSLVLVLWSIPGPICSSANVRRTLTHDARPCK